MGIRGIGKTVTLSEICNLLKEDDSWIVVNLNLRRIIYCAKGIKMGGNKQHERLHFLITNDGFCMDDRGETITGELLEWKDNFKKDRYRTLYKLGFVERPDGFDAAGFFLCQLADSFFRCLTSLPELELTREETRVIPKEEQIQGLINSVPFMLGSEYVCGNWINGIFEKLNYIFSEEISAYEGTVALYLAEKSQHLRVPERIFFHLVESKDMDFPFAFLATYATKDEEGKVRHVPLQYALTEYEGKREKLLELLGCLNKVAEVSELVGEFVEKGELFHPLKLTTEEAYRLLKDIPRIEEEGIICRIPNWWRKHAEGIQMSVNLGEEKPVFLGMDTVLSMCPELVVDGVPLSREEIRSLLAQQEFKPCNCLQLSQNGFG